MERLKIKFMKIVLEYIRWEYAMGRHGNRGVFAGQLLDELNDYEAELQA